MSDHKCGCGRSDAAHDFEKRLVEVVNDLAGAIALSGNVHPSHVIERVVEVIIGVGIIHPEWILGAYHALELEMANDEAGIRYNADLFFELLSITRDGRDYD